MELTSEKKTFTSEEYLELERKAEFKSELINGKIKLEEIYRNTEEFEDNLNS